MYDKFNNTEELGLDAVKKIVNHEFGWIYRPIYKRDIGIDAEFETKADGLIIKAQIKTGLSNFKKLISSDTGLIYYVDKYHYDYWLTLRANLLFIAHLPENQLTIWQVIKASNLVKANKRWKLYIPFSQVFSVNLKDKLLDSFAPIQKPVVIYDSPTFCLNESIINVFVDLGRHRNLDDEIMGKINKEVQTEILLFEQLENVKNKIYSSPENIKLRFQIAKLYIKLNQRNDAIIELNSILNSFSPVKLNIQDRIYYQLAKFYKDTIKPINSNEFVELLECQNILRQTKPTIWFTVDILGKNTHLISIEHYYLEEKNTRILLKDLSYKDFVLPSDISLEILMAEFYCNVRVKLKRDEVGISPEVRGVSFGYNFCLIQNDVLLKDYSVSLIN